MKLTLLLAALLINALLTPALVQLFQEPKISTPTVAQVEAKEELNAAARSYRDGNFTEAQAHSERALALDPANKTAPLFIARTVHAQYRPGIMEQANISKAKEAIAAYQRILAQSPDNDEAYKAIAYLYGSLKEEQLLRDWLWKRAADSAVVPEKRAEAYILLASKDWDCSFKITELPANKITTVKGKKATINYIKPKDESDFELAQRCASSGLQMTEMAIALTPENEAAWSYKTNLLLELTKLAEMAGNLDSKSILTKQYEEALLQVTKLSEGTKKQQL